MACKAGKKGVAGVKTQAAQASDRSASDDFLTGLLDF